MTLYTKSAYASFEESDGLRICVMSRLTENDGKTPSPKLAKGKFFDIWNKLLAPPENLVGAWYREELKWEQFTEQYLDHLYSEKILLHLERLASNALTQDITILCVEKTPEYCHRKLLAEECQKIEPSLEVVIR